MDGETGEQLLDWVRSRYFGKYRGLVRDNRDPARRGRLQVQVPAVLGRLDVWAMPCVPYAGDGVGFYSLPETGTGVWVEFEAGDPSFPIWVGCFWADGELPAPGNPRVKLWKTESLTVRLDDGGDEAVVRASSGSRVIVGDDVLAKSSGATQTVGGGAVVSEAGGARIKVGNAAVSLNDGALEVT